MIRKRNTTLSPRLQGAAALARKLGVFRARDFVVGGYPREYLRRLVARAEVNQIGRGLYNSAGFQGDEHQTMVEAAQRVPSGVVCLLSALRYHKIGTQSPGDVWLALPRGKNIPRIRDLPVRLCRFSAASHEAGIEEHHLSGGAVRIYSPAKTIADCFKFRHKIGLDVCVEALGDCLRQRRATLPELSRFAAVCRVARVLQPYLEAMA